MKSNKLGVLAVPLSPLGSFFQEAPATLAHAEQMRKSDSLDGPILRAMSHRQLGQRTEAKVPGNRRYNSGLRR
jgi:hypothetical protein